MEITVIGAGAMGGLFSAYLSLQNEVTVIDVNGDLVAKINADGLKVREPNGSARVYHPKASRNAEGMPPADLVVVFVKSTFSESALAANRAVIGPETYLMTLQNGSGHEDILLKFTDASHIVIGTTQHNAGVSGLGITNHGGSGPTAIGRIAGEGKQLEPIADNFTACGIPTVVSEDVRKMIWNKMFTNVSASALTGVLQVPLGFISRDPHAWGLCQTLIRETAEVAAALGMDFDAAGKTDEVRRVCENSPGGLTSIYADLKAGRKTEVDTISGSVVRAGKKCGVPTPCMEFAVNLIHSMEDRTAVR
jgi:2-dehydropantoate 2-reductase